MDDADPASLFDGRRDHAMILLEQKPNAKIAILMQNYDFGKILSRPRRGLGDRRIADRQGSLVRVADRTLDGQVVALKQSNADVLFDVSLGKQTAQVIKKLAEMNWKPLHMIVSTSTGKPILEAAGLDNCKDIITATPYKQAGSAALRTIRASGIQGLHEDICPTRMRRTRSVSSPTRGRCAHQMLQSWAAISQESIVAKATNMKGIASVALLPGITYNTTPTDYAPIKTLRLQKFNGATWDKIEDVTVQ